jgi:DNA-binding response OmpR family regulator
MRVRLFFYKFLEMRGGSNCVLDVMNKRRILIVDDDRKNLKVLEMNFQAQSYMVATAMSVDDALSLLNTHIFEIVLSELSAPSINGYQLLKEVQRNPNNDLTHVIFLSIKSDAWNRVKSLKLGAKDFIVKPVHVSEIVARVNMVQNRLESCRDRQIENDNKFSGRLEDLPVIDLIEVLGSEKKTGILSLNNENGHSGQIIFNRGHIMSATTESLRAEDAFYKMIYWNRGRFSMIFAEVQIEDEFTISNMGLLLQGAKRMDLRNELLKQLPSLDAVVITTANFKKIIAQKDMNLELKEFMQLFDGERSLGRIIDDSHENEIVTLKRIAKLYKLGFLHVLKDFSAEKPVQFKPESEEEFAEFGSFDQDAFVEESDQLQFDMDHEIDRIAPDNFPGNKAYRSELSAGERAYSFRAMEKNHQAPKNGDVLPVSRDITDHIAVTDDKTHVILLSSEDRNNKDFIAMLTASEPDEINISSSKMPIYHGTVNFRGGDQLHVLSLNPNEQFPLILDYFKEKALGYIFLIDLDHVNWSYHRYLFKSLRRQLAGPVLIIVKQRHSKSDFESQQIRENLELNENHLLRFISGIDENSCRRVLFTLLNELQGQYDLTLAKNSERIITR